MAFLNTNSSLIIDNVGDIYNFKLTDGGIEVIVHEKHAKGSRKPEIISRDVLEYDVSINENDEIDVFCKRKDKSLSIYRLDKGEWIESKISKQLNLDICGLKIMTLADQTHIFYYMKSIDNEGRLNIYHHYIKDGKWNTNIVKEIYESEIIKPIEIIKNEEELIIGYYDLGDRSEDIFLKKFNMESNSWSSEVNISKDDKVKLYLDILQVDSNIHVTYSEYQDENLVIKHKIINSDLEEIDESHEHTLSSQTNCSYPTVVYEGDVLWNVWTEYESVVSVHSDDKGLTWSNPYVWSDSKKNDFTRYKFSTSSKNVTRNYLMNYSFGKVYPDLSFLGFGDLTRAVESLKKKMRLGMML